MMNLTPSLVLLIILFMLCPVVFKGVSEKMALSIASLFMTILLAPLIVVVFYSVLFFLKSILMGI